MSYGPYISKITLPDGNTYDIKDAEARELIAAIQAGGLTFTVATDAASTPLGVTWENEGTVITGSLQASKDTKPYIVLVPHEKSSGTVDYYREYVTVNFGTEESPSFAWEYLGNTDIDISTLGDLAYKDSASGNVTFSTADSASFSNGAVNASATYTPAGSVSTPTITVTPSTTSISVKDDDGSVSAGTAASFTRGSFSGGSFTQGTDSFTAPVLTTSVASETLTIGFTAGSFTQGSDSFTPASHGADTFTPNTPTSVTLPTFKSQTVATGITSASSTQPTFTGTEATISSSGTATGDVTLTKTDKTKTVTVS